MAASSPAAIAAEALPAPTTTQRPSGFFRQMPPHRCLWFRAGDGGVKNLPEEVAFVHGTILWHKTARGGMVRRWQKQLPENIRVGVGGWTFPPWRGGFYPDDLPQKQELHYASRKLTSIEINGTYYGSQKPESFAKWHDETPEDFVFSVKGPRFTTNRRVLGEAAESIGRFFGSGVLELRDKLGPINWQFAPTKKFDAEDFEAFLKLLPKEIGGRAIRHVVEVRHESFRNPAFIALARAHEVAVVIAGDLPRFRGSAT